MTTNGVANSTAAHKPNLIVLALVATFAIAAFFLTRPSSGASSLSPVTGLMTLKASAQQAMPYESAIANGKPTLIEFYADWCTTCQAMAPTLATLHQQFGTDLNWVMLDIDDPQWQTQVQQFQVTGVPHVVLREGSGAIADTLVGKVPKSVLASRIQQML